MILHVQRSNAEYFARVRLAEQRKSGDTATHMITARIIAPNGNSASAPTT